MMNLQYCIARYKFDPKKARETVLLDSQRREAAKQEPEKQQAELEPKLEQQKPQED
jgi:hypothetical protein